MARTSSRLLNNTEAVVSSVQENTAQENETVTKLHTAAYCRLSVENRGRKDEGTIETQVKMEKGYRTCSAMVFFSVILSLPKPYHSLVPAAPKGKRDILFSFHKWSID